MNSEELELSLRTEFESYLKDVVANIRQDVTDFQKNFEAEFEKHKSQLDEAFRNLSTRFESSPKFDQAFTESVVEHLRLARDEGAQITATAFGEAEKLKAESTPPASYDQIRDAINDISSQTSQSAILKSLVEHAGQFTPRGAFFIVKNDHFVGWRVFGEEGRTDEKTVREIHFPMASETILAEAIGSMATKERSYGGNESDAVFLDALAFGQPDRMYAIPLTARGRGVAVLYADYGTEGVNLNVEALETLVRVAGLTVELLAASQSAKAQPEASSAPVEYSAPVSQPAVEVSQPTYAPASAETSYDYERRHTPREEYASPRIEAAETVAAVEPETVEEYTGSVSYDAPVTQQYSADDFADSYETAKAVDYTDQPSYFEPAEEQREAETIQETSFEPVSEYQPAETESPTDFAFRSSDSYDAGQPAPVVEARSDFTVHEESNGKINGSRYEPAPVAAMPEVEVATVQPTRTSRLSDRNVDLPIDVADDERRLHNDARRFARLLVSEIKLYNEQKVTEGRESNDLYDRLREAIDRSREMYDKRVQPTVASKFDYFHYELVTSLAEGDDKRLGASYPGANA